MNSTIRLLVVAAVIAKLGAMVRYRRFWWPAGRRLGGPDSSPR